MTNDGLNEYALNLINSLRPDGLVCEEIPSDRQLVGTNRLWGALLGKAYFNDLKCCLHLENFINIAIFCRSILVLDDFIFDEEISSSTRNYSKKYKRNIESSLLNEFKNVGEEDSTYWHMQDISLNESFKRNNMLIEHDLFRSSINKCLIFFNPYRLKKFKSPEIQRKIEFLEVFFFACQLLDDFQDLEEDASKKANHNIFLHGKDKVEISKIIDNKLFWGGSLLRNVLFNLTREDVIKNVSGSSLLEKFHENSIDYLKMMTSQRNLEKQNSIIAGINFELWNTFDPMSNIGENFYILEENQKYIRPEFMQTYSLGVRDITDV